jgi:hypothetical protein
VIRSKLSRRAEALLYVFAAASYIGVGLYQKSVLNWIVGPLWLIVVIEAGARLSILRDRRRRARAARG